MKVLTLSGFKEDNRIKQMGTYNLYVPVCHYGMVESIHNLILQQIHKKGYLVIVVTNQSGVERGYLTEEMLQKLNAYLQKETGKVISKQGRRQERKPFLSKDGNAASSRIL